MSETAQPGARRLLFLLLALVAISAAVLIVTRWVGAEDLTTAAEPVVVPVDAVEVEAVDTVTTERYFTGRVAARRSSPLSFERSARVEAVLVEEGDFVRKGRALARLDSRDLDLRKAQLEATRLQAQARLDELLAGPRSETIAAAEAQVRDLEEQLALSRVQTKRRQELLDRQAISREEFDRLDFQSRSFLASYDAARARLEELQTGTREEQVRAQQGVVAELDSRIAAVGLDLDKSVLRAPFSGRVGERLMDEGAFASPGQIALTVLEHARPEVRIGLPADAAQQISRGDEHEIEVGGSLYRAEVIGILPELDEQTRTATVLFELKTEDPSDVFAGQIARMVVERSEDTSGYWVPLEALSRGVRGLWACYVVVPAGEPGEYELEQRQVEILSTEGDRALVRGSIQAGDKIVRNGVNRVTAGQRVRPQG